MTLTIVLIMLLLAAWYWVTQPIIIGLARSGEPTKADKDRLRRHVEIITNEYGPRDGYHAANLDRVASYIREHFADTSARISEQTWRVNPGTYRNICALFGKGDRARIVFGAHYDTWFGYPGADDNASGVAALLELARIFNSRQLTHDVELVAYSLEEPPFFGTDLMGSAIHASSLKQQNVDVRMMLSIEMVGYFRDSRGSQKYPLPLLKLFYPSAANFIAVVGKMSNGRSVRKVKQTMAAASPLPVYSMNGPRAVPGIDYSDHVNYWSRGYDAVMITDTAFYRNPHYHTPTDTSDTLDYKRLAMVVDGLFVVGLEYR